MRLASTAAAALWLCACTLDAGRGFATLTGAELEVGLDPASARIDGATVLTASGERVELERFTVTTSRIELQQLEGTVGSGGSFDPADPPPGYTLCHGGHCHAEDGRLVSYEEIQASLAGGVVRWVPLVTIALDRELDVLGGERVAGSRFDPSAELPRGTIGRVYVALERLELEATATGGALGGATRRIDLDVPLAGAGFVATVSRPLDRDHPAEIALAVEVPIGGRLFDGLDLSAASPDPTPLITDVLGTDLRVEL